MAVKKGEAVLTALLALENKSDKEVRKEELQDKLVDFKLDCEETIQAVAAEVKRKGVEVTRQKRALEKAIQALEAALIPTASNYDNYVQNITDAKEIIATKSYELSSLTAEVGGLEATLAFHKERLTYLKS